MRTTHLFLLCFFTVTGLQAQSFVDPQTTPGSRPEYSGVPTDWQLVFSDEFNDTTVDPAKWVIDNSSSSRAARPGLSIDNWFWRPANVSESSGNLVLRVDKADNNTMHCGSVRSAGKYQSRYGYYEARVLIAEADKGTHTAFWMTSAGQSLIDGTGHDGGEVDIFESAWTEDYTKAVIHIDGYGANKDQRTLRYETPDLHDGEYHTFGMLWTEDEIRIYYDGQLGVRQDGTPAIYSSEYDSERFIPRVAQYLWLSDGASFGYSGDNFTSEPIGELTNAYFDYVRVWQPAGFGCADPTLELEDFENENQGGLLATINNASASEGAHMRLSDAQAGDHVTFEICQNVAGYYQIDLTYLTYTNFGIYRASIETSPGTWTDLPGDIDMYTPQPHSRSFELGEIYLPLGNHRVRFTCVGKNPASSGFTGSFDRLDVAISDVPLTCFGAAGGTVRFFDVEAESITLNDAEVLSCNNASNGEYVRLSTDNTSSVSFVVNVTDAGTYQLNIGYISAVDRQSVINVNGTSLGAQLFPDSGNWCFDNGTPAEMNIDVALNAGDNTIEIVRSGPPVFFDDIGVSENCSPAALPVALSRFTATPHEKHVALAWTTASETSNDFIAVERSVDGLTFTEIGRKQSRGDYNAQTDYELVDETPAPGTNYYRLRQQDLDGTVTYSVVLSVDFSDLHREILVYPTVLSAGRPLSVDLRNQQENSNYVFAIVSQNGERLGYQQLTGGGIGTVATAGLSPGVYYLTNDARALQNRRFVIIR